MEKNEFWQDVADCWRIPWVDDSPEIQAVEFDETDGAEDLGDELRDILGDLDLDFL